jgi:hypothetical protein
MSKLRITVTALQRALDHVLGELSRLRLWSGRLDAVEVLLVPVAPAYGYFYSDDTIRIPAISLCRLRAALFRICPLTLRGILRHEFGHALVAHHRALFRSRRFLQAFGRSIDSDDAELHSDEHHVSAYAATQAEEDFCEVFEEYVRCQGVLPEAYRTPAIRRKWRFVAGLPGRLAKYRT